MKNQTQESYNLSAEKYRINSRITRHTGAVLKNSFHCCRRTAVSSMPDADRASTPQRFVEHNHVVTGIDFSTEMIKLAKENCPEGEFIAADLKDINPEGKYDAVCASFVIVHMTDAETDCF